jgi:alkanesulfonate monooxygenase SsuD/methylene tetrahydromethanopterin reductase-like flavin-dependent oxidoreductase (luciferase family)
VLAAGIAGVTSTLRVLIAAIVLPLHDPLAVAEQTAVLDLVSRGRLELVFVPGYVKSEFAMFNRSWGDRVTGMMRGLRTIEQAWTGEAFEYEGRVVRVTPRPFQEPRPTFYLGGSTAGAAERAATVADGMLPSVDSEVVRNAYFATRMALGLPAGRYFDHGPALAVVVAEDPDRMWAALEPHLLHDSAAYAALAAGRSGVNDAVSATEPGALRASGHYRVVTPDDCIELYRGLRPSQRLTLHPLVGGSDPDLGWQSLHLFADRVLPHIRGGAEPLV